MQANLSHYLTAALIEQTKLIVAGNTSALGNPLTVSVYRARPTTSAPPPPPCMWFEAVGTGSPPEVDLIGNTTGQDSQGNQQYGAILWGPLVQFGLRCRQAAERDDIFDRVYGAFKGTAINGATGNRWVLDVYANTGVLVADVTDERFDDQETTPQGPLFEATATLVVSTMTAQSVTQQTITAVDVTPVTITLYVPAT